MAAPLGASPPTASLRPVLRDPDQRRIRVTDAERLIAKAKLRGDVGFAVADAKTGLGLESGNPRLGLPPATRWHRCNIRRRPSLAPRTLTSDARHA